MRERYGRFQPQRLPVEIKDVVGLAEAYRWLIAEILGRRLSPRGVGPILASLKRLQGLLPEASVEKLEQRRPFDEFLELPENQDLKERYVAYLRSRVRGP